MKIVYQSKIYNWGETSRLMIYRCKNCYSIFVIDTEMVGRLNNTMFVCSRCNDHILDKYN